MQAIAEARSFLKRFAVVAGAISAVVFAAILLLDPYGNSPVKLSSRQPIMDINQRYMYPRIARAKTYDSVVIGTSTSRLLDPHALDAAFDGRFANLAMNSGTAWEQTELAKLYLRHNPSPKTFVLGIDQMWCLPEQSIEKITFRGFPTWMYDENPLNDLPEFFNLKTIEIAGRVAAYRVGLMPERIRGDGYEIFTPPEAAYDLSRARFHIWRAYPDQRVPQQNPPVRLSDDEAGKLVFPAIPWLDD
ncbi:MAG: hypothetical protein ACRCTI_17415, partial [Beijerinckiaceae bacterium]